MPTAVQSPRRVLFVDDDARFLEITKELMSELSRGQWEVFTAQGADKAFTMLKSQPMDLVVIDVQMGVMDGIQMLALLNRGYPNVQKVALTGFANETNRAACLSNGAELFLEKPTTQDGWRILFTALSEVVRFKPEEGFRGVLRRVGIQDVLQMECLSRNSSILEISDAKLHGKIFVQEGQIIHAQVGDLKGEDAFNRLLGLSGGQFNLKPFVEPPARSIDGAWEFLIMEAARKRDEADSDAATAGVSTEPQPEMFAGPTALRKRDEADSGAATAGVSAEPQLGMFAGPTALRKRDEADSDAATAGVSTEPQPEMFAGPTAATVAGAGPRPAVEEMLICSAHGEVWYQWQCRNVDLLVNILEFVSRRAQRVSNTLPLGEFNRLIIETKDVRAVIIIGLDRGVLIKTRKERAA